MQKLTLDKHLDGRPEWSTLQSWVLRLAGNVCQVVPRGGLEPQDRGDRRPLGETSLVVAVLPPTCEWI